MEIIKERAQIINILKYDYLMDHDLNTLFQLLMPMVESAQAEINGCELVAISLYFHNKHYTRDICFRWTRNWGLHGHIGYLMLELFQIVSQNYQNQLSKKVEEMSQLLKTYSQPIVIQLSIEEK